MIFARVFDHIFTSASHIAVLRALLYSKKGLTGREVSRYAGVSPKTALKTLTNLEELKIINRTIGGRDHLFVLNINHYLVKNGIIPLLETEKEFLPEVLSIIKKKLSKICLSIVLFGSVARKNEDIDSDLDICLIVKNKTVAKEAEKMNHQLFNIISDRYGATFSAIIFTQAEFKKRALKNSFPINNILKEGKLISGRKLEVLLYGKKVKLH